MYIDKLDYIVNKYNNTYHTTIKRKPVEVKSSIYNDSSREFNGKDPKWKMVIFLEYPNIKIYFQKITLQIGLKKVCGLKSWKYFALDLCY